MIEYAIKVPTIPGQWWDVVVAEDGCPAVPFTSGPTLEDALVQAAAHVQNMHGRPLMIKLGWME